MNTIRRRRVTRSTALISTLVLASALAACSSDAKGDVTTANPGGGASYVKQSQALLDMAAKQAITGPAQGIVPAADLKPWTPEDMPVPVAAGKKSVKVAVVTAFPAGFPVYAAALLKAIGAELGWQVQTFAAATPDPAGASAAMNQAILTKPDVIIAPAVPSVFIAQGLAQAKAKGIKTIDLHGDSVTGPGFDAYVPASEGVQKALLGAWAVAKSDGKANAVVAGSPPFADANAAAAIDYIKACTGCKVKGVEFSPDVFSDPTKTPASLASAISSADVDYVIFPNGSTPLQGALNGIKASRSKNAQLLVNSPGPPTVQYVRDGQTPMLAWVPPALMVLTAIDDVNRMMAGAAPLDEQDLRMPVSYWTKENAPKPELGAMTAAELQSADFLTPFEKAWGIQLKDVILGVTG